MIQKFRQRLYYSILISLLIHTSFVVWSFFVNFLPPPVEVEKTPVRVHFSVSDKKTSGYEDEGNNAFSQRKTLKPIDPNAEVQNLKPSTISPDVLAESIAAKVQIRQESLSPSSSLDSKHLDARPLAQVSARKVRKSVRTNFVEVGEIPKTDFVSGSPSGEVGERAAPRLETANVQSAKLAPVLANQTGGSNEFELMKKSASNLRAARSAELGANLTFELSKYQDPKGGQKYFKLLVRVRDATINFAVIPKEVIFLVDSSQSIGKDRLEQFQSGVVYSLNHLNPDDRFNVVVFKDRLITLNERSVKPTPENVANAIKFLKSFKAGARTDVYSALKSSVTPKDKFNPSYRVLLSDGFPTKGVVDARQVINEISVLNDGQVSIFAFGGGVDVSSYMLDFIAYKNRGWSQVVGRYNLISKDLSKMYDRIKDPLLLNLRYHISGLDESQVFPRSMPDFFKGSEFIVYGTYTTHNDFFIQVLGNVIDKKKEFVVNASLEQATTGDKDIAWQWAFHKVYYLIGQLEYKQDNEALINQIDELCAKFKIVTPYSKTFRKFPKPKQKPGVVKASSPNHGTNP